MPPKPGTHPLPGTFIHAMPSFLPKPRIAGLKWISGFPENTKKGLPMILGLLILNDSETGVPLCVMDTAWLTAVRTAVVSGIAMKHPLREGSSVLGIIGAGNQGKYHVEVIKHICHSIREVKVFDTSPAQIDKFRNHIQQSNGLKVKFCPNPQTVFNESDLVVTATGKQNYPVVEPAWLKRGGSYIGIESFRYWGEKALLSADKFITGN